jgi:hypothetical protein
MQWNGLCAVAMIGPIMIAATALLSPSSRAQGFAGATTSQVTDSFNGPVSEPIVVLPNNDYVLVDRNPTGLNGTPGTTYAISVKDFATNADLNNAVAQVNAQIAGLTQQIKNLTNQLNYSAAQDRARAAQGVALAGAFTILPPEPGDRFSISVNGAGFAGQGAGSVSATYRVADKVLLYGGYARSNQYNMVKGGLSLSFN